MITKSKPKDLDKQRKLSLVKSSNKANIFLGLIEYELNSLLGASHLVDYISIHIRLDLEKYLLNIFRGRIEYELIYSLRGAKHRVDYSVHIR